MSQIPTLPEHVRAYARAKKLWQPGDKVLLACSGGGDSVALLLILHELASVEGLELHAAHLHHGLRGNDADEDARFVEELCRRLGIQLTLGRCDVRGEARARKVGLYESGRELRRTFLLDTAQEIGATHIAVGHTLDDRAETLLINLLRGTGLRGLTSMRPRQGQFIRPLLGLERRALRDILQERGQEWREDSSNLAGGVRARLRNEVFPLLDDIGKTDAAAMLGRAAGILAREEDMLHALGHFWAKQLANDEGIELAGLRKLPADLARRVVVEAFGRQGLSEERWEAVWEWIKSGAKGHIEVSNSRSFVAERGVLKLLGEDELAMPALETVILTVPGRLDLPQLGMALVACMPDEVPAGADTIYGVEPIPECLTVRSRQPGDRIKLPGGTKKVQNLFVDAKIPRRQRNLIPLVVMGDMVLWAVGVDKAAEFELEINKQWAVYWKSIKPEDEITLV
jgi:tRNA(Ile)-lysidine synthase